MSFRPEDTVEVTNHGDHPVELWWNSQRWVVPPGESRLAPVEAAINAIGDPRAHEDAKQLRGADGTVDYFIPSRNGEVKRIRQKYGFSHGPENGFPDSDPNFQFLPRLAVKDMDGEVWKTIIEDPIGESVGIQEYVSPDINELAKIVERQQRQLNLQAKMLEQQGYHGKATDFEQGPTSEDELPHDQPFDHGETRTPDPAPTIGGARPGFPAVPLE
jgi:hypothetical protein